MTKMDKILDTSMKISNDVAVIRQHMKDMNDRLRKHDEWIRKDHPKEHKEIDVKLAVATQWSKVKTTAISLLTGVVGSLATYLFLRG